ncbi:hypothetical protein GCM10025857_16210 [Alicyclobacillus contaminans]|nr:hypothetical protein GCM10025857_16210 [Alicyclobacillus contaminans]
MGAALHIPLAVERLSPNDADLPVGEWRFEGGTWRLRLDAEYCVVCSRSDLSDATRAALRWTLDMARRSSRQSWQSWLRERVQLRLQDGDGKRGVEIGFSDVTPSLPAGYLVWLHPWSPSGQAASGTHHPAGRPSVADVANALAAGSWLGWLDPGRTVPYTTGLVYCTLNALDTALDDMLPDGEPDTVSAFRELQRVKQWVSALLVQLEADLYFPARAVVGASIRHAGDVEWAIQSLRDTWRVASMPHHAERVLGWGEAAVEHLLLALSGHSRSQFRKMVELRTMEPPVELSGELLETLLGVIRADLNVSEAARLLYLHRNTLLNRIERIRQHTGYDIRHFADALALWLLYVLESVPGASDA